jgi:hypothetical protein
MSGARAKRSFQVLMASLCLALAWPAPSQGTSLAYSGGPVMVDTIRAYLIYWLPNGIVLEPAAGDGVGNFETLTQQFYSDLAASPYMAIATQYPGTCAGARCVLSNRPGSLVLGGSWVDTAAYPMHGVTAVAGSQENPLLDADIQNEVTRAISRNGWTVDANAIFFVITGVFAGTTTPVEECQSDNTLGMSCTFGGNNAYCAYHDAFGSVPTIYSFIADVGYVNGCSGGIRTAVNGQLSSDRAIVTMSHELMESVTDGQFNAWYSKDPADVAHLGWEIGDLCNQLAGTVTLSGHSYQVQSQWSNASGSCVLSYPAGDNAEPVATATTPPAPSPHVPIPGAATTAPQSRAPDAGATNTPSGF